MKSYLSYFKLKFKTGLQYRAAALAGIATQLFFGIVYISVYIAFYESDSASLPMPIGELVSYLWLNQAFFALVYMWYKDKDILSLIKKGNIAYELCRPQDLYLMWSSKILGERLSNLSLRCIPVIIIACLLPGLFHLSLKTSLLRFVISIASLTNLFILDNIDFIIYSILQ